jgi:hypothetical protein
LLDRAVLRENLGQNIEGKVKIVQKHRKKGRSVLTGQAVGCSPMARPVIVSEPASVSL